MNREKLKEIRNILIQRKQNLMFLNIPNFAVELNTYHCKISYRIHILNEDNNFEINYIKDRPIYYYHNNVFQYSITNLLKKKYNITLDTILDQILIQIL